MTGASGNRGIGSTADRVIGKKQKPPISPRRRGDTEKTKINVKTLPQRSPRKSGGHREEMNANCCFFLACPYGQECAALFWVRWRAAEKREPPFFPLSPTRAESPVRQ